MSLNNLTKQLFDNNTTVNVNGIVAQNAADNLVCYAIRGYHKPIFMIKWLKGLGEQVSNIKKPYIGRQVMDGSGALVVYSGFYLVKESGVVGGSMMGGNMVMKYADFINDLNRVKAFLEIDEIHASKEVVDEILGEMVDTGITWDSNMVVKEEEIDEVKFFEGLEIFIDIDAFDENRLAYCLIYRLVDGKVQVREENMKGEFVTSRLRLMTPGKFGWSGGIDVVKEKTEYVGLTVDMKCTRCGMVDHTVGSCVKVCDKCGESCFGWRDCRNKRRAAVEKKKIGIIGVLVRDSGDVSTFFTLKSIRELSLSPSKRKGEKESSMPMPVWPTKCSIRSNKCILLTLFSVYDMILSLLQMISQHFE